MGTALRHEELLTPIKFGVEKICDKTELTYASTDLKTPQLRPKVSLRRALLLGVITVLMPLSFVQTAQAQETTPVSVGQMLQPGGVQLPLGITAEAEVFYVGTGVMAADDPRHGATGVTPLNAGGLLTTGDPGFAEPLFPLGRVQDATGILADGQQFVDNGTATNYADALGFKITLSEPMPISYFYGLDIDAARDEWQTAFGYDDSGNFVAPVFSTQPNLAPQDVELTIRTGINPAGWGLSLPSGGIELVYKSGNNNGITPATLANQVLYNFEDEPLKEIYFLFGLERRSTSSSATNANASALSALFVPNPEMDVTKTATVGALQADNTFDITYDLLIENTGGVAFETFSLTDDLAAASNLGSVFNNITPAGVTFTPVVSAGGSNFPAPNPAFDGNGASGNAELINPADTVLFQPGDSFTLTFTANVDAGLSAVTLPNLATASAQPVGFTGSLLTEDSDDDGDENNGDNPTVITAPAAAVPAALPPLNPDVCGGVRAEAYLLDGMGIVDERQYQLASNISTHDPDVFFGILGTEPAYTKNADGSVTYYFDGEPPAKSVSTDINTLTAIDDITTIGGSAANQTDAAEFWRMTARFDGVPGQSYNYTLDNGDAFELLHYWVEDSAGNVIESTLGDPNTANGWSFGTSTTFSTSSANGATAISGVQNSPISYTIPASSPDGIVYLRVMVFDPNARWAPLNFTNAPSCSTELLANKTVAVYDPTNIGLYSLPGNDVIYTITVSNDGNGAVDADTIKLLDILPPEIDFWNGDIDDGGPESSPVTLTQTAGTGMSLTYATDIRFGTGSTPPAGFEACSTVTPDSTYRSDLTYICFNPKGVLSAGDPSPTIELKFRGRIK